MLSTMRKGASGILAKAMMMFLVFMFGVWGIGDMLRQHSASLATVGSMKISLAEFDMRIRNMRRSMGNLPPEMANTDQFRNQVMQGVVQQALLLQETQKEGLVVSDKTIAKIISRAPQFKSATGTFDANAFHAFLRANEMNEAMFIDNLRKDVTTTTLLESLSLPKPLTFPTLAKALATAQLQSRSADVYVVPSVSASSIEQPDDKTLQSFYKEVQEQYLTPEYRTIDYVVIPKEALEKNIRGAITDQEIADRFALEKMNMATPEKRDVTQLLFSDEAAATSAAEALKAGESVSAVKEKFKAQVTPMRDVSASGLPGQASDTVFALKQSGVSAPVHTDFGWHVFKLDGITPGKTPSLAESKNHIIDLIAVERSEDQLTSLSGQLEDALAAGDSVEKAAAGLKMDAHVGTLSGVDQEGRNAQGGGMKAEQVAAGVLAKGYAMDEGESSGFAPAVTKDYVAVYTRSISPQAPKVFAEVKPDLLKRYIEQEQRMRSAKKAQDAVSKLVQAKDSNAVVTSEKLQRRSVSGITLAQALGSRSETAGLPAMLVRSMFDAKLGELTPPARMENGDWVIARVTQIQQSVKEAPQDTVLSTEQRSALADAMYSDYLQHLVSKYPVKINEAMLKSTTNQP